MSLDRAEMCLFINKCLYLVLVWNYCTQLCIYKISFTIKYYIEAYIRTTYIHIGATYIESEYVHTHTHTHNTTPVSCVGVYKIYWGRGGKVLFMRWIVCKVYLAKHIIV